MTPNRQQNSKPKKLRDRRLVFWAFALLLLVFGALVLRKYLVIMPPPAQVVAPADTPRQLRQVILYFATPDGTRLVAEGREIEDCLVEEDCLRETVQALINGPIGDLAPILPSHAILNNLKVEDSTVILDFDKGLVAGHPGGTQSELLTVYGLVDTLSANFPHLRQVQLLIDGAPVETLKGHVDLRRPVTVDFSLVEEGSAPTGDMSNFSPGNEE